MINEGKDMLAQQRCGTGADSVDFLYKDSTPATVNVQPTVCVIQIFYY